MNRSLAPKLLALSALTAAACDSQDNAPLPQGEQAQSVAGIGADVPRPKVGDECSPAIPGQLSTSRFPEVCNGAEIDFRGACKNRYDQVRCYIQSEDETTCLPATDPLVLPRTQPAISSAGFSSEFVIEAADEGPLSESCNAVIACCDKVEDAGKQKSCVAGQLDGTSSQTRDAQCEKNLEKMPACRAEAESANPPPAYRACCYHICGRFRDN